MLRSLHIPWTGFSLFFVIGIFASGCVTTSEPVTPSRATRQDRPSGFFDRVLDNFSERECNVRQFTCPYGVGSPGEPCECIGPDNVVYQGYTVK